MVTMTFHLLSIAPMMDYTDRHFRYIMRRLTMYTLLYTEMITSQALIHGDRHKLLDFSPEEKPVALQLGGTIQNSWRNVPAWGKIGGMMR